MTVTSFIAYNKDGVHIVYMIFGFLIILGKMVFDLYTDLVPVQAFVEK